MRSLRTVALLVGGLMGCQAILALDPPPERDGAQDGQAPPSDARPLETSTEEGAADAGSDVSPTRFCPTLVTDASVVSCNDFEHDELGYPSMKPFTPGSATASVVSSDSVSPPNALLVEIPSPSNSAAGIMFEFGAVASGKVTCHTRWRVVSRPSDPNDNFDLIVFELLGNNPTVQVLGVAQELDGTMTLFANGPKTNEGQPLSDGWHALTFGVDRTASAVLLATDDDDPVPRFVSIASSWTHLAVYVGAYQVTTGPWRVLFDNVYCTRMP